MWTIVLRDGHIFEGVHAVLAHASDHYADLCDTLLRLLPATHKISDAILTCGMSLVRSQLKLGKVLHATGLMIDGVEPVAS